MRWGGASTNAESGRERSTASNKGFKLKRRNDVEGLAGLSAVHDFDDVRSATAPRDRQKAIEKAARTFRVRMLEAAPVPYYRSHSLVRVPYPTKYAFLNACTAPTPYIHIVNKMFVVQFETQEGLKTLLVSASDVQANRETPFFKRLSNGYGRLKGPMERFLAPLEGSVESALASVGIHPDDVDYLTYDHLHTQDLRRWLGAPGRPALFPNAKLLVMRQEWESTRALLPPQQDWYCPQGIHGIDETRVICLDGSVKLGESVALVHTPGHTEGNHSIVVRTPEGLMVTSENGVGPDSYAPLRSKIPGLRQYAQDTGMEVILNGNTLEAGIDQYLSMILEREIAGFSERNPEFYNVVASSELQSYWGFPGIKPTFSFGELSFGQAHGTHPPR